MNINSKTKTEPLSRKKIRIIVKKILEMLDIKRDTPIPVCNILDFLSFSEFKLEYEIVKDERLKNEYAVTDLKIGKILIRESVFDKASKGSYRDRFTIAHEIGHYFLHCLYGNVSLCRAKENIKPYESPEWQADTFAGELLVNTDDNLKNLSIEDIQQKYEVSRQVAEIQKKSMYRY